MAVDRLLRRLRGMWRAPDFQSWRPGPLSFVLAAEIAITGLLISQLVNLGELLGRSKEDLREGVPAVEQVIWNLQKLLRCVLITLCFSNAFLRSWPRKPRSRRSRLLDITLRELCLVTFEEDLAVLWRQRICLALVFFIRVVLTLTRTAIRLLGMGAEATDADSLCSKSGVGWLIFFLAAIANSGVVLAFLASRMFFVKVLNDMEPAAQDLDEGPPPLKRRTISQESQEVQMGESKTVAGWSRTMERPAEARVEQLREQGDKAKDSAPRESDVGMLGLGSLRTIKSGKTASPLESPRDFDARSPWDMSRLHLLERNKGSFLHQLDTDDSESSTSSDDESLEPSALGEEVARVRFSENTAGARSEEQLHVRFRSSSPSARAEERQRENNRSSCGGSPGGGMGTSESINSRGWKKRMSMLSSEGEEGLAKLEALIQKRGPFFWEYLHNTVAGMAIAAVLECCFLQHWQFGIVGGRDEVDGPRSPYFVSYTPDFSLWRARRAIFGSWRDVIYLAIVHPASCGLVAASIFGLHKLADRRSWQVVQDVLYRVCFGGFTYLLLLQAHRVYFALVCLLVCWECRILENKALSFARTFGRMGTTDRWDCHTFLGAKIKSLDARLAPMISCVFLERLAYLAVDLARQSCESALPFNLVHYVFRHVMFLNALFLTAWRIGKLNFAFYEKLQNYIMDLYPHNWADMGKPGVTWNDVMMQRAHLDDWRHYISHNIDSGRREACVRVLYLRWAAKSHVLALSIFTMLTFPLMNKALDSYGRHVVNDRLLSGLQATPPVPRKSATAMAAVAAEVKGVCAVADEASTGQCRTAGRQGR